MKNLKFLFGAFCAVGMMASCSSSDDVVGGETTPDGIANGQNLYLSVSVMSANEGTRATEVGDPVDDDGNKADYEKGTGKENDVTNAYFYFYNADGSAANVVKQGDTYVNYYNSPTTAEKEDGMPNVEMLLDVTVVINTEKGDLIPDKIVAVLNADKALTKQDGTGMSLSELSEIVNDYSFDRNDNKFVMSSSVYSSSGNGSGVKKMEVDNIQSFFKTSDTEAKKTPVDIYVERVLAKVSVGAQMTVGADDITVDNETLYYTGQTTDKSADEDKRVYVKFLGWNIATETEKSYLFKNIDPKWTDKQLGITNWTWPDYFRSFRAMNPAGMTYINRNYNDALMFKVGVVDQKGDMVYNEDKDINYTYVQENASKNTTDGTVAAPEKPTKILVASQLVDKTGKPIEIAEWRGIRSDVNGVLITMANFSGVYYQKDENTRALITPEMIRFADDASYAVLVDDAESNTFYLSRDAAETADIEAVNKQLKELGNAKVWKDGKTYYYTDIRHLGKITQDGKGQDVPSVGAYGVVRNHSYQVVINSVTGLGTPVYNPDDVIDPEQPKDEESYLAARIKVLSWRVVKSTVDLK
ncbi:Mfa1 family fimbria major subunit [Xylanibacter rodentium]|uniref:Mfa1 family fimbria major subunit n=1 Tax=Xylanibacter rodentium TaxID=2736289 RepID=UPI0015545077|nr:Mfa1 family fimbria major subunit [Xylanibacter rodentium]NPE11431.1 Mfa1 family fimbria major subunit [Prevotella sp. PJ1A]NPE38806.1 Mfa1 family fimbria major subunit [Prevotella sp. PCJ2]